MAVLGVGTLVNLQLGPVIGTSFSGRESTVVRGMKVCAMMQPVRVILKP